MAADPKKLKSVKEVGRKDVVFSMALVPGTEQLFFGSSDFNVYRGDLAAEKMEPDQLAGHNSYVTGVALAGDAIVSGAYDGKLIWWKADSLEQVRSIDAHERWIRGVVASPDGKTIASVADDMVCRLWDAASGKRLHELRGHEVKTPHHYPSMLYVCAFSPDGKHIATGDKVGHIVVWEVSSGKQVATMEAPVMYTWDPRARRHSIGGIRSLAFSPDGRLLAVGGIGKIGNIDHLGGKARIVIFDWQKAEKTHEIESGSHNGLVEHLAFHHQGEWLLGGGGSNAGFLLFYDLKEKKAISEPKAPMHIHELALTDQSETIYAVGHGKIVKWELKG